MSPEAPPNAQANSEAARLQALNVDLQDQDDLERNLAQRVGDIQLHLPPDANITI